MEEVFEIIDEMLNEEISFSFNQLNYKIINNFNERFIITNILDYLEQSSIYRYDKEYDTTILEIIGGYLLLRIDMNFEQLHLIYCRNFITIPTALCLIC